MGKLGRGLSALIPDKPLNNESLSINGDSRRISESTKKVDINSIIPNPYQPRRNFDNKNLIELSASIKEHGLIQPLLVIKKGSKYELIAGERRLRASKLAGLKEVPIVLKEELPDKKKLELAIIENIQRENLNVVEEAEAYKQLMDEFNLTQEDLAKRVGKSRSTVANKMRILSLPPEILEGIRTKKLTEGHARALLPIKDPVKRLETFNRFLDSGKSVRELENQNHPQKKETLNKIDPEIKKFKDDLEEKLATRVEVKDKNGKGNIIIKYFSKDELKEIESKLI